MKSDTLNQREHDLVRYQRQELYRANLITEDEYADLAKDHAAVRRLEDYDVLRAKLIASEAENKRLTDALKESQSSAELAVRRVTEENERLREALTEAPHANGCDSHKPICVDCGRPAGKLGACHGKGEVVNGRVLEGAQYSEYTYPHPCNCFKRALSGSPEPAPHEDTLILNWLEKMNHSPVYHFAISAFDKSSVIQADSLRDAIREAMKRHAATDQADKPCHDCAAPAEKEKERT
jgi:hypothetical protein